MFIGVSSTLRSSGRLGGKVRTDPCNFFCMLRVGCFESDGWVTLLNFYQVVFTGGIFVVWARLQPDGVVDDRCVFLAFNSLLRVHEPNSLWRWWSLQKFDERGYLLAHESWVGKRGKTEVWWGQGNDFGCMTTASSFLVITKHCSTRFVSVTKKAVKLLARKEDEDFHNREGRFTESRHHQFNWPQMSTTCLFKNS